MHPQVHAGTEGNNNRWDEIVMAMWEDYQARHMETRRRLRTVVIVMTTTMTPCSISL
jgi:hypothetical protein